MPSSSDGGLPCVGHVLRAPAAGLVGKQRVVLALEPVRQQVQAHLQSNTYRHSYRHNQPTAKATDISIRSTIAILTWSYRSIRTDETVEAHAPQSSC